MAHPAGADRPDSWYALSETPTHTPIASVSESETDRFTQVKLGKSKRTAKIANISPIDSNNHPKRTIVGSASYAEAIGQSIP